MFGNDRNGVGGRHGRDVGILEKDNGNEGRSTMEYNAMRTATETRECDNGGTVEMWDIGYGRHGWRWRRVVDDRSGGDVRQQGQRQQRYGKMATSVEEMQNG